MYVVAKILYKILVNQMKQFKVGCPPPRQKWFNKTKQLTYLFNKIMSHGHLNMHFKKRVIKFSTDSYFKLIAS